jgi:hypothetical protein
MFLPSSKSTQFIRRNRFLNVHCGPEICSKIHKYAKIHNTSTFMRSEGRNNAHEPHPAPIPLQSGLYQEKLNNCRKLHPEFIKIYGDLKYAIEW